jgi:DNA processing protein
METDNLRYKIGLTFIPGIGSINSKKLVAYCGGVENVFKASKRTLLNVPGIGKSLSEVVLHQSVLEQADKEIEFLRKHKIQALFYLDNNYPERLKNCPDSPVIIYMKGDTDLNHPKIVSIVGTRNATNYGKASTEQLIRELAERNHNPLIISGLAYGIDITAHRMALKYGLDTIAVLAHGLTTIYPQVHTKTAKEIIRKGALVTEFRHDQKAEMPNFVKRNRVIAGLADVTIVVESSKKGGALITADIANSYNRDVFAIPGRINDTRSEGCNRLIKSNRAALLEKVEDLEYIMNWDTTVPKTDHLQGSLFTQLSAEEKLLVTILKSKGDCFIDDLAIESNLPPSVVSSLLLQLEFSGIIKSMPGKIFRLL